MQLPSQGSIAGRQAGIGYNRVRDALPDWEEWLRSHGISRGETLALHAVGEPRAAAALLALLALGQSLLLWRHPIAFEANEDQKSAAALPSFCGAGLLDESSAGAAPLDDPGPGGFRLLRRPGSSSAGRDESESYVYLPTSGTTGAPKLVAYRPDVLCGNAANCVGRLNLTAADRVLVPVPLAHMYGLGAAFLPSVLAGATVYLLPQANLIGYLAAESAFDPTTVYLTPGFCQQLLRGRKRSRRYRLTVVAGDAFSEQAFTTWEQRHGCTVNLYGSTELGAICAGSPDDAFLTRRDSVGAPLPGVRVAPAGAAQGGGGPFPLRVWHPFGCAGYADVDGTPSFPTALREEGWYATMDLGRLDSEGRLQLAGRLDDAVKRDGFLVALADVERALHALPGVERAVVVAGGSTPRGRELVAFCALANGAGTTEASLRRALFGLLPAYAVPDRFLFLEQIPLTPTGKPDRAALAALAR